jgi:hypothetical protein
MILMRPTITKSQVHTETDGALVPGLDPTAIVRPAPEELDGASRILWTRLTEVREEIARLRDEGEVIRDALRTLGPGRYTVNSRPEFDIYPNRQFSQERARLVLPDEVIPQVEVTIIDPNRVKQPWKTMCQVEVGKLKVAPIPRRSP